MKKLPAATHLRDGMSRTLQRVFCKPFFFKGGFGLSDFIFVFFLSANGLTPEQKRIRDLRLYAQLEKGRFVFVFFSKGIVFCLFLEFM